MPSREAQLREEVEELTELLREDRGFADVRKALIKERIDPKHALLAGFFEDEVGGEYGLVVLPDKAIAYARDTKRNEFVEWQVADKASKFVKKFPAAKVAEALASRESKSKLTGKKP